MKNLLFNIDPVDTCGAGDSFRGAVTYGIMHHWEDGRIVAFACAVAAKVCLSFPGCVNGPAYQEVIDFMEDTGY